MNFAFRMRVVEGQSLDSTPLLQKLWSLAEIIAQLEDERVGLPRAAYIGLLRGMREGLSLYNPRMMLYDQEIAYAEYEESLCPGYVSANQVRDLADRISQLSGAQKDEPAYVMVRTR